MRTITLELLRHGPSHNQLLSPLTPYLALCENHAPVTVNIPFEHNQFLHRLTALTYQFGDHRIADDQRKFQLQDTGRELSRILSAIPGLTAELNRHKEETNEVIHLRLVLSASELALLPFELVLAGNGFPGFGQPLLLQNQSPICLTRETRRVRDILVQWTPKARVLFVFASPASLPEVPVQAHLLALRRAVEPWVRHFDDDDEEARRVNVAECLHVLADASIEDIQRACATGEYTHVHILAHGVTRRDGFDLRFGLALHSADPQGVEDVVGGERLASALRPLLRPDREGFARPVVVTLASCNAANQGTVVGAGASIAHALQSAGIPLVIAGQFPLSFAGSVELVETLYDGLLWGADPRALLMDLRRRMHVLYPQRHDWAALTAYASLSADFEDQLEHLQIGRAKSALAAAMDYADKVLLEATDHYREDYSQSSESLDERRRDAVAARIDSALLRIEQPWHRLVQLSARIPVERVDLHGLLGSLAKRRAEVTLLGEDLKNPHKVRTKAQIDGVKRFLAYSRDMYRASFETDRSAAWAAVQFIALSLLLEDSGPTDQDASRLLAREQLNDLWRMANAQSVIDAKESGERAGWALGNLVELAFLATLLDISPPIADAITGEAWIPSSYWREVATRRLNDLVARTAEFNYQDYSTYRQLQHYAYWFGDVNPRFQPLSEWAQDLLLHMPTPRRSKEM